MDCSRFKRALYHFQADELPHEERAALQDHLSACPPCARLHDVEDRLLRAVRARLRREEAPPGLETRIRARLAATRRDGASGWWRAPWFAAVATSLVFAALVWPTWRGYRTEATVHVNEAVTLVDRACDEEGRSFAVQRSCLDSRHLNALRRDDGSYLDLSLDDEQSRRLVTDREARGNRFHVEGVLYERIHTLRLETVRAVGAPTARLSPH